MRKINEPIAVPPQGYKITYFDNIEVRVPFMAVRIADGVTIPMPITWYWHVTDYEKIESFDRALLDKVDAQLVRL